jgi:hypothetical protein
MFIRSQLEAARVELSQKSSIQIDAETAVMWGARTVVALERFKATGDLTWYQNACDYRHEALEHAGSAGIEVLAAIREELSELLRG